MTIVAHAAAIAGLPSIASVNEHDDALHRAVELLFGLAEPLRAVLVRCRPFQSHEALVDTVEAAVNSLSLGERIRIVNAHSRLGAPERELAPLSVEEQRVASAADPSRIDRLRERSRAYEERFGFRFVTLAEGRSVESLLAELDDRIERGPCDELRRALGATVQIARCRLFRLGAVDASHH